MPGVKIQRSTGPNKQTRWAGTGHMNRICGWDAAHEQYLWVWHFLVNINVTGFIICVVVYPRLFPFFEHRHDRTDLELQSLASC